LTAVSSAPKLAHQLWLGNSIDLCKKFQVKSRVGCIITDPPFGVDNQSNSSVTPEGKANATKILNDQSPEEAIAVFNAVMDSLLPATVAECDMYIFTAHQVLNDWLDVADSLGRHGFRRSGILVWEKDGPGQGNLNAWGQGMEYILYLKKGNRPLSDKRRNGVLHVPQIPAGKLIHPHEKPMGILEPLIKMSTNRGDFIVDPFGGSASTVRASRNLGRSCVAIELDPARHAIAQRVLDETASDWTFD
jgi:site-specific DNA-methyltransferase (adenine-specific)